MKVKKIGIITITSCLNYGNRLQNYALQETIKKMGMEVETIKKIFKKVSRRQLVCYRIKVLIRNLLHINERKGICDRERTFNKFSKKNIKYSKYWTYKNTQKSGIEREYDVFVCGSDQIWNPDFEDTLGDLESSTAYFAPKEKRVAYAASIGVGVLNEKYIQEYTKLLSGMKAISMREKSGADIVKNLIGRDVPTVLDPTLLLTRDEWMKLEKKPKKQLPDRYIVTYFLGNISKDKREYIDLVSEENEIQVIEMSSEYLWDKDIRDKESFCFDPAEFLYVISHSKMLLTDSFHGCVFAIIFDKPFRVFNREGNWGDMWSRIETLIDIIGKVNVVGTIGEDLKRSLEEEIQYDRIKMERLRCESLEYLKKVLE